MDSEHKTETSAAGGAGEPLAMCMVCRSEFALTLTECPTCAVELSVVRRCPGCTTILSAKHASCIYCGHVFQRSESDASPCLNEAIPRRRWRRRQTAAVLVSVGVFATVFTLATLLTKYEEGRSFHPVKIASSYALRDATVYQDAISSSGVLGHIKEARIVDIVGYRLSGEHLQWYQLSWNGRPGYTPAKDFAPPKALKARGSKLLELAILEIRTPELFALARGAVEHYRGTFPESPDGDRLLWFLAEHTREVATHSKQNEELANQARQEYQQLASGRGDVAENARKRLGELEHLSAEPRGPERDKPVQPPIQIVDGSPRSAVPPMSSGERTHQITLVNETELSVRVPPLINVTEGVAVQGVVARSLRAGQEVAVRAGSGCNLRVLQVMRDRKSALLQLVSVDVGNRRLGVSSPPVVVPIASSRERAVNFRIATPLVIRD